MQSFFTILESLKPNLINQIVEDLYLYASSQSKYSSSLLQIRMSKTYRIKDLIDSFEPDEKNKERRYREFLYHCFMTIEKR